MDTKTLIAEAKARFNHNSAKEYLKEKYEAKLLIAEQGGLWRADQLTISFLDTFAHSIDSKIVLLDTFGNPVEVNAVELLEKLQDTYREVMNQWYAEWKAIENNR